MQKIYVALLLGSFTSLPALAHEVRVEGGGYLTQSNRFNIPIDSCINNYSHSAKKFIGA